MVDPITGTTIVVLGKYVLVGTSIVAVATIAIAALRTPEGREDFEKLSTQKKKRVVSHLCNTEGGREHLANHPDLLKGLFAEEGVLKPLVTTASYALRTVIS